MSFDKYQFLSWARRGIASNIEELDTLGKAPGTAKERARVPVTLHVNDTDETKTFALLGAADITGLHADMVVRTEPLDGIPNFEPNYLAYAEFYDEDFPWRYTPARADGLKLRPWLALIVLREDEFSNAERRTPSLSIKVNNPDALPAPDELHLWAHVHSNLPHGESNLEKFIESLEKSYKTDPDGLYSRLICPRKLVANTDYHAFLVPTFEVGRLAGLERPTKDVPAQKPAWPGPDLEFPVYHRWAFRTGENLDFEELVKLLEPRVMDERVGVRPMDCSRPGFVQADAPGELPAPSPKILQLEGALLAPTTKPTVYPDPTSETSFQQALQKLLNLNVLNEENPDEDPYVAPPFYGMYHAMGIDRKLPAHDFTSENWYDALNRDPRTRTAAGFGNAVVQNNQDKLARRAWEQLSSVLEQNKRAQATRFTIKIAEGYHQKFLRNLPDERLLALTRPAAPRILTDSRVTVHQIVRQSLVPEVVFTPAFRRTVRPGGALARQLSKSPETTFSLPAFVGAMNRVDGIRALPDVVFQAIPGMDGTRPIQAPATLEGLKLWSLTSNLDEKFAFNIADTKLGGGLSPVFSDRFYLGGGVLQAGTVLQGGGVVLPNSGGIQFPNGSVVPIGGVFLPGGVGGAVIFHNTGIGGGFQPIGGLAGGHLGGLAAGGGAKFQVKATADVPIYAAAYTDFAQRFEVALDPLPPAPPLPVPQISVQVLTALAPDKTYLKLFKADFLWPDGFAPEKPTDLLPAMAYPDFPEATYKYLLEIDKELLLPNLQLIPPNTLSLLRTNRKFIESYLVGLNYEMGRELLWREYPTDLRGSYFRQFWDVSGLIAPSSTAAEAANRKDVTPLDTWGKAPRLGKHAIDPAAGDTLVFVIRGDLLKKYPNTVIFAQKAFPGPGPAPDTKRKTIIHTGAALTPDRFKTEVKFPQYKAQIQPDIHLLGFDLTIEQAAGTAESPDFPGDKMGWFFVIAEVPGEPRFGMDISYEPDQPTVQTWNDLSWENFSELPLSFIEAGVQPGNAGAKSFTTPAEATGKWARSAADMAAILIQRPVMIATHAREMLDLPAPDDSDHTVPLHLRLDVVLLDRYATAKLTF